MAESYISALSADFDPGEFSDQYREALEAVIDAKVAGREIVTPEEQPAASGQVVDLMDALRRSVAEAKARRGEGGTVPEAEAAPAKKAAAKSQPRATAKAPAKKATKTTEKTAKTAKKTSTKKPASSGRTAKKAATKKSARKTA